MLIKFTLNYLILITTYFTLSHALSILPSFKPNGLKQFTNGTNFTSLLLVETTLYVGGKNNLFKLDASNIENTNSLTYANVYLPSNSDQKEQCISTYYSEKLCNNFIKSIVHRNNEKDLYVCGSYSFTPRLFQFSYDLALIKEDDGYGYCSLNPLDSSTAIWIDSGNPMSIGSLYTASLLDASTKTQPVEPVIYRPELKRGDKTFQYLRSPKFDSDWLYQPTFITSFDVDDYVFFFLKEKSLEELALNQEMNYARVVRVCKSDMGTTNLGNQWSSMRKTRLTCVYNNTYLNELEDVIRVDSDLFVGLFSLALPNRASVSFACEFTRQSLLQSLNAPAHHFKELTPSTQYWSKASIEKTPQNVPNDCDYNSQTLKDDVVNFLKTHCLIGDLVLGNLIHFVPKYATALSVDTISSQDEKTMRVYYFGTSDGRVLKMSSHEASRVISEWKISDSEVISELKLSPKSKQVYALTENSIYQIGLNQCEHYPVCSVCMRDPYCGWNMNLNKCQDLSLISKSSAGVVSLNEQVCSRIDSNKQQQVGNDVLYLEYGAHVELECTLTGDYGYLFEFIEWKKDGKVLDFSLKSNNNLFLTWNKNLLVVNKMLNETRTGPRSADDALVRDNAVFTCLINKNEILSVHSVIYKQKVAKQDLVSSGSSRNQKCITAENYIKQYNNWCDEYSRYHKALNDWEELKDKSCSSAAKPSSTMDNN